MKTKKMLIEIRTFDSALQETAESFEKISQGKRVKKKTPTVDYDVPSLGGAPCRVAANVFL